MKRLLKLIVSSIVLLMFSSNVFGQDLEDYLLGEEQQLQIVVYIMGAVSNPGQYTVSDNMDVVELISKANGTTDFSNLGKVSITRHKTSPLASNDGNSSLNPTEIEKEIITFDVTDYLRTERGPAPPKLQAGDVVYVPTNKWKTWRTVAAVLRDLSIVASTYFLYLRATKD